MVILSGTVATKSEKKRKERNRAHSADTKVREWQMPIVFETKTTTKMRKRKKSNNTLAKAKAEQSLIKSIIQIRLGIAPN